MFIACSVGDACFVVEWQAEPVETAMPSLSRWTRMFSPSTYAKEMLDVLGKRFARSAVPFRRAFGICFRIWSSSLFRSLSISSWPANDLANSHAAPKSYNVCHRRSPGAPSSLLAAADNERRQLNTVTNVECADALRRMQLVT